MTYTINTNTQYNSLEIFFDGKPNETIRNALKELRFRWHGVKKCWYGYADEATARAAIEADAAPDQKSKSGPKAKKATAAPAHGVKVGDLFYASWGYEQTNVNFFQVVELVGSSSVRIREVYPELLKDEAVSGMSEDRWYKLPEDGEMLRVSDHPSFVEDNERGDLHRVNTKYGYPSIKVGKPNRYQTTARPYDGGRVYVSWYY